MKKRVSLFLIVIMILTLFSSSICAGGLTRVYVNGVKQKVYPRIKEGVAYLPANPLALALNIKISWNSSSRIVKVNDRVISTSPYVVDGKLYLPVESITSAIGAEVEWDGQANAIRINTRGTTRIAASGGQPEVDTTSTQKIQKTQPTPTKKTTYSSKTPKQGVTSKNTDRIDYVPRIKAPETGVYSQNWGKNSKSSDELGYSTSKDSSTGSGYIPNPPSTYSGQPTRSAYPDSGVGRDAPLRPLDAPPSMPSNLSLPPISTSGQVSSREETFSTTSSFRPRSESNDVFRVTVSNIEVVDTIKDYYKPKPGYKFVVVYLSQQNTSDDVQIYTGRFSLLDQDNSSYDYIEGLSNFWLIILRPGGINFGYLVFEIPADAKPMNLVLHGLNRAPLSVALR